MHCIVYLPDGSVFLVGGYNRLDTLEKIKYESFFFNLEKTISLKIYSSLAGYELFFLLKQIKVNADNR